jgi:chromate reductase, NAD(P)H dehydrogenase (quinone)
MIEPYQIAVIDTYLQMKEGLFDELGDIGPGGRQFFQTWMEKYVAWVKMHAVIL